MIKNRYNSAVQLLERGAAGKQKNPKKASRGNPVSKEFVAAVAEYLQVAAAATACTSAMAGAGAGAGAGGG